MNKNIAIKLLFSSKKNKETPMSHISKAACLINLKLPKNTLLCLEIKHETSSCSPPYLSQKE